MPEEQLKLDAASYLSEMRKVVDLTRNYNQQISKMSQTIRGMSTNFGRIQSAQSSFTKHLSSTSKNLGNLNTNMKEYSQNLQTTTQEKVRTTHAARDHKREVLGIRLSYKELAKLILARLVTLVFHRLQLSLRQSVGEMEELQFSLAELQTLAADSERGMEGLERLTTRVRELSESLGIDRLQIVNAQYQILSNSMANSAREAEGFLVTAANFARVTGTELPDSVNLLSSVINSFGMNVIQAENVSSMLFATIRAGRIHASEIANVIGRVSSIAAEMNVEFEDMAATLAVMTQSGITAREAITSLGSVVQRFLRPTQEMQKLFDEWGVASGDVAIQLFGLSGSMERFGNIIEQEGTQKLADLFSEIQAIRGVTLIDSRQTQEVAKEIREIGDQWDQILEDRLNVPAQRFREELTALSNEFDWFGENIIKSATAFDTFGVRLSTAISTLAQLGALMGAGFLVGKVTGATRVLHDLIFANNLLNSSFASSRVSVEQLTRAKQTLIGVAKALKLVVGGLGLAATVAAGAWLIYQRRLETIRKEMRETAEQAREMLDRVLAVEDMERQEKVTQTYGLRLEDLTEALKETNSELTEINDIWRRHEFFVEDATTAIEKYVEQSTSNLENVTDEIENLNSRLEQSKTIFEDLLDTGLEDLFRRQIRHLPIEQQIEAMIQRAEAFRREGLIGFMMGDEQAFRDSFSRVRSIIDELDQFAAMHAHTFAGRELLAFAEQQFLFTLEEQLFLEQQISQSIEQQLSPLEEQSLLLENQIKQAEHQLNTYNAELELRDQILSIQNNENISLAQKNWELDRTISRFSEEYKLRKDINNLLESEVELKRISESLSRGQIKTTRVQRGEEQLVNLETERKRQLQTRVLNELTDIQQFMVDLRLPRYEIGPAAGAGPSFFHSDSAQEITRVRQEIKSFTDDIAEIMGSISEDTDIHQLEQIRVQLIENISQLANTYEENRDVVGPLDENLLRFKDTLELIGREFDLNTIQIGNLKTSNEELSNTFDSLIHSVTGIQQPLENFQQRIDQIGRTIRGANPQRGFARGGSVSSADTIPAFLSPGEEVISASSAAAYRSILKQMNISSRQLSSSRGFAAGGTVTNSQQTNHINLNSTNNTTFDTNRMLYQMQRANERSLL